MKFRTFALNAVSVSNSRQQTVQRNPETTSPIGIGSQAVRLRHGRQPLSSLRYPTPLVLLCIVTQYIVSKRLFIFSLQFSGLSKGSNLA
jgi:hypothetical protein